MPIFLTIILIFSSYHSYLLFHSLAELFAIIVGVMMYVVAQYTHPYARDHFVLYLAIGFFWVAGIDLVHALAFKGMTPYPSQVSDHFVQFWLVGRFLEWLFSQYLR